MDISGSPRTRLVALLTTALVALTLLPATWVAGPSPAHASEARDFPTFPRACYAQVDSKVCRVTRYAKRPWIVLWGDSHALQYLDPMTGIARQRKVNLVVIYAGGCPLSVPFPASSGEPRMTCDRHNARALGWVRDLKASGRRVRVVLGSYWDYYRKQHRRIVAERETGVDSGLTAYERHIARLGTERSDELFAAVGRAGIQADVLAQSGTVPDGAPACPAGEQPYVCDLPRSGVLPRAADNRRWLRALSRHLANRPLVIDTSSNYCGPRTCYGRVGDVNTFWDQGHLALGLTRTMRDQFRPSFDALREQRRHR
jgi:hypothetical protein